MLIIIALFLGMFMVVFTVTGWRYTESPKHLLARLFAFCSFFVALIASIEAGKVGTFIMMAQTLGSLALLVKLQMQKWSI